MDRRIVYIGAIPQDIDVLQSNLDPYLAVSKLADAVLGKTQILNNFLCIPTSPTTMTVNVGFGEIYSLKQVDTSDYGSITTNSNQILKQGVTFDTTNLSCPAPVTVGYSVNYLVQVTFNEQDTNSVVLPYYNSADINNPLSGPGGSGAYQNTVRQDGVTVSLKTGIAAPTGTQTTPSPDSGYTGAYVVTVAYGQTTIISGNISVYSASSFITETLTQKVSIPTGDLRWAQIARVQSGYYWFGADTGTVNSVVTSLSPAISGYSPGNIFHVLIANTNTGASTINVNGLGVLNIKLTNGNALNPADLLSGMFANFEYDGTNVQLLNPASWASQYQVQKGSLIYSADGGSANAYTATLSPVPASYTAGMQINVKIANTNTGSSTINVNSLGAKSIKLGNGANVNPGDLLVGMIANLSYDGTNFQILNPNTAIKKVNVQAFQVSGTYTPSPGLVYAIVEVIAGGGGGGGAQGGTGTSAGGSGAGGGGYSRSTLSAATIGASQTVTIGAGGTGGIGAANGVIGGDSLFGSLVHTGGGQPGVGCSASTAATATRGGGGGVNITAGEIGTGGDPGQMGFATGSTQINVGGGGGGCYWCGGGNPVTTNINGSGAISIGGGGGGAASASSTSYNGGAGGSGFVLVTEYCNQ